MANRHLDPNYKPRVIKGAVKKPKKSSKKKD